MNALKEKLREQLRLHWWPPALVPDQPAYPGLRDRPDYRRHCELVDQPCAAALARVSKSRGHIFDGRSQDPS